VIHGFGFFGCFRGIEESHVRIPILNQPADPIRTFTADDHPEAAVVDREGSRFIAGYDHFDASAALADAYDGFFVVWHLFSPLGRVSVSNAAPDTALSGAAFYVYQERASALLVETWHSENE
jgi:hypothetical protein